MFRILPRYLFGQTLRGVILALTVVLVLIVLVDFVEQTRTLGDRAEGLGPADFAGLTLLKTPMLVEAALPFIILFGVMMAMFRLNRRSELVVMRAAGVSAWRFTAPALFIALTIGVLSPTVLNPVAADMQQRFEDARDQITGGAPVDADGPAAWFREVAPGEQRVIRAEAVDASRQMLIRPAFIVYSVQDGRRPKFVRRIQAERATLADGRWRLEGAISATPGGVADPLGATTIRAYLDPSAFDQDGQAQRVSFWGLRKAAAAASDAGLSPTPYRLRFLRMAMTPVLFLAMALIATAAAIRLVRLGGAVQLVVLAGVSGFLVYFLGDLLGAFALNGRIPVWFAAAAAPVSAALAAMAVIAHLEDS